MTAASQPGAPGDFPREDSVLGDFDLRVVPNVVRPVDLVWAAAGCGLVVGWAELALTVLTNTFDPRITLTSLRTNDHFAWMIPLFSVTLFTAVGLMLAVAARFVPKPANWLAWRLLPAFGALALLCTAEGLFPAARVILACGLGISLGCWIERRSARLVRLARVSVIAFGGALVLLAAAWAAYVGGEEARFLSRLPVAAKGTPNVLLIVLDTVRADSMSVNGYDRPTTPNLERLAAQGVRFTEARSTAPWTLPSHASMFTGHWSHDLSVSWDRGLDSTRPTIAEYLSERGYATAGFVGNAYYCNARYGLGRGFARYEDFYENRAVSPYEIVRSTGLGRGLLQTLGYKTKLADLGSVRSKTAESINQDALDWIAGRSAGRPFFVFLNYNDAHGPYQVPEGPDPRFGAAALPAETRAKIYGKYHRLETGKVRPEDGAVDQIEREAIGLARDSYESCIAYIDHQIGMFFEQLERRGLRENTMVIVTSDHGEHFHEHGFLGHGLSLYRHEVHVPLIVFPPGGGRPARRVIAEPVSLRDLPATIADLVGPSSPAPFPGQSLAALWNSPQPARASRVDYVLSEVDQQKKYPPNPAIPATMSPVQALVAQGKVYIRSGDRREELYDLDADPRETRNLIDTTAEQPLVARCRQVLGAILAGAEVPAPTPIARNESRVGSVQR